MIVVVQSREKFLADKEKAYQAGLRKGRADRIEALEAENERLREELAAAYVDQSGTVQHASDCATSNAPAMKPGPCDCKENAKTFTRSSNV